VEKIEMVSLSLTSCCAIGVSCLANILEKKWCLFLDGKGRHALNLWFYTHFVLHVFPYRWEIFNESRLPTSHRKDITV